MLQFCKLTCESLNALILKIYIKSQSSMKVRNLRSHLAYQCFRIFRLFWNTICESLVKIQNFRHEWWSIICKISKIVAFNKILSYLAIKIHTKMGVFWLNTQSVKDWWRYNTSNMNDRQIYLKNLLKNAKCFVQIVIFLVYFYSKPR